METKKLTTKKYTIMIIEDEALLLQLITKKLDISGYDTISCVSGVQALDYLRGLTELPDVIWLDYYLKDMDGLEFMHTIRSNQKWKDIPVVVVSNSASEEKVHNMLALGAKKYFLKAQYKLDDIVDAIGEIVEQ